jgi:eukaryotic-like serine/threonine-protein kinase
MDNFKQKELFEREIAILQQLQHPAIPTFVETFQFEQGCHQGLYLVQKWIEGDNLANEFKENRLCS